MFAVSKPFGLRIPLDLREPLEIRAKENGRSLNSEIVQILKAAIQRPCSEQSVSPRRYQHAVLELSKAYVLASASDEARFIRDEVCFFRRCGQHS